MWKQPYSDIALYTTVQLKHSIWKSEKIVDYLMKKVMKKIARLTSAALLNNDTAAKLWRNYFQKTRGTILMSVFWCNNPSVSSFVGTPQQKYTSWKLRQADVFGLLIHSLKMTSVWKTSGRDQQAPTVTDGLSCLAIRRKIQLSSKSISTSAKDEQTEYSQRNPHARRGTKCNQWWSSALLETRMTYFNGGKATPHFV